MTVELHIEAPENNAVFTSISDSITFTGNITTTDSSGIFFAWNNTVAPWATGIDDAVMNTTNQGTTALSFSTNMNYVTGPPESGGWGMGTQWIMFTCQNKEVDWDEEHYSTWTSVGGYWVDDVIRHPTTTHYRCIFNHSDKEPPNATYWTSHPGWIAEQHSEITKNGIDGGKDTVVLPEWTIDPLKIHVLRANLLHPQDGDRFDQNATTGVSEFTSPVPFYWEVKSVLDWNQNTTSRTTTPVTTWRNEDHDKIDDELVFELWQGSIGGNLLFKSDTNGSTYVWDADSSHSTWKEHEIPALIWGWSISTGTYTVHLKVYQKDDSDISINTSVTFEVVP